MLKIYDPGPSSSPRIIRLEGKLLEDWIDTVRRLFDGENSPQLDLSGVRYVDRPGTEFLRQLIKQGVVIESYSPFVAELLKSEINPDQ